MSMYSVVDWHAEHEGYRCGYCKSPDSNYSHGMTVYHLTVDDYQALIDRGWRRSGSYVYKPTMNRTCCPQYTIRCNAITFNLNQSHKKVMKRVNKYLSFGTVPGKHEHYEEVAAPSASDFPQRLDDASNSAVVKSDVEGAALTTVNRKLSSKDLEGSLVTAVHGKPVVKCADPVKNPEPKPGVGEDPTKPKCLKAKLRRLEKKKLKVQLTGENTTAVQNDHLNKSKAIVKKTLEDYLGDIVENPVHKLEVKLVRSSPKSSEFVQHYESCHKVYIKYQTVIHGDPPSKPSLAQYTRFLVESPLQVEATDIALSQHGFGSFHQIYILDGKIIAVGVLDILPKCVSSVYLYYDPDYSFLSLGTYSAMRELALIRELHRICPSISYYYMGFYIHSCPKMRYKGQYDPSYLLCPETYTWHEIDKCRAKLDNQRYCRFAEPGLEDEDSAVDVNGVLVLHQRQPMSYGIYRSKKPGARDKKSVSLYSHLVGMTLARRMLLYRQ